VLRVVTRLSVVACASGIALVVPLLGHPATSPQVQIIKGAKYRFEQPSVLVGAGGNVWAYNSGSCVNTIVRASNGAFVKTLATGKHNFCDQVSYGVSGSNIWAEGGAIPIDLVELKGSTGAVVKTVPLAKSLSSYASGLLAVAGNDVWISSIGGTKSNEPAGTWEVSLSSGHVLRSLPEPGSLLPECLVATTSKVWTDGAASSLYEYSASTGHQLASIALAPNNGAYPFNMVLVGADLWVPDGSRVYVLDASSLRIVATLSAKADEFDSVQGITTNGHLVWTLSTRGPSVSVFNVATRSLQGVLRGSRYGFANPDAITWYDGRVWVGNAGGSSGVGTLTAFT
jgi:hypothetical protein